MSSLRYPWHSLQTGLPLYLGLPSAILSEAAGPLQMQHSGMPAVRGGV